MPCLIKSLQILHQLEKIFIPDIARLILSFRYVSPYYDCAIIRSLGRNKRKDIIYDNSTLFKKSDYRLNYCVTHNRLYAI